MPGCNFCCCLFHKKAKNPRVGTPPPLFKAVAVMDSPPEDKNLQEPFGTVIVKTLHTPPTFRDSYSVTPPKVAVQDPNNTQAVLVNFELLKIKKGLQGSISSAPSAPRTLNLSVAADLDPVITPSSVLPGRRFTFDRIFIELDKKNLELERDTSRELGQ